MNNPVILYFKDSIYFPRNLKLAELKHCFFFNCVTSPCHRREGTVLIRLTFCVIDQRQMSNLFSYEFFSMNSIFIVLAHRKHQKITTYLDRTPSKSIQNVHALLTPHRWGNSQRDRLEYGRSWVRAPVGSNQRLYNWYLLLLR